MDELLKSYLVDVDYPEVSGIEHLQMLKTRSELATITDSLSASEQQALANADQKLAMQADKFLAELSRFVDLATERQQRQTSPDEWWWHLDILVRAPAVPASTSELVAV
jgi:hypothetical protein